MVKLNISHSIFYIEIFSNDDKKKEEKVDLILCFTDICPLKSPKYTKKRQWFLLVLKHETKKNPIKDSSWNLDRTPPFNVFEHFQRNKKKKN